MDGWLRPGRRFFIAFLLIVLPPAATLVVLGLRLLEQVRTLARQRQAGLLDHAADSAVRTLEKESVDGDLKAAIEQYRKIVATYGSNRAFAAKALLQMGQCHEKVRDAEAGKAYERVARDFADQTEAVAQARARLAALGQPHASPTGL